MVVGVVIANPPSMLTPLARSVLFMATPLVIVGGAMEMIVAKDRIVQTKVPILLELTQTGTMTLKLLIISLVS
jgi:hypothetical protein